MEECMKILLIFILACIFIICLCGLVLLVLKILDVGCKEYNDTYDVSQAKEFKKYLKFRNKYKKYLDLYLNEYERTYILLHREFAKIDDITEEEKENAERK